MKSGAWFIAAAAAAAVPFFARPQTAPVAADSGYVDSRTCAGCHASIYASYQKTGMARSFYRPDGGNAPGEYFHAASDTHFTMLEKDGRYYQRRYQIGFEGKETNIDEKVIDFVMGSGNHVRTYLHRTAAGALEQLPLAWYSEKGGYWAMNPGYDKPDQPDSRRKISYECIFCHNAYPAIPAGHEQPGAEPLFSGALPEGIDCQRCHGPGARHIQTAQRGGDARSAILNPARLSPARQMEVCMQCHLETTSFPFPHSIIQYDRGPFSYRPDEPLANFILFFDKAQPEPGEDRFHIVNSAYRLRMSQCFLRSAGKLQCTTCHDPHGADKDYNAACLQCHAPASLSNTRHPQDDNCTSCHMPKRRTDDVVHAVMTDHFIQRRKPAADLLTDKAELNGPATMYRGDARPYYPNPLMPNAANDLALAEAQIAANNTSQHRALLRAAIEKYRPREAGHYIELADALRRSGDVKAAIGFYDDAIRIRPDSAAALIGKGQALDAAGQQADAAAVFRRSTELNSADARSWQELGQSLMKPGQTRDALAALQKSIELDPGVPEAHYALGSLWAGSGGEPDRAEASFREAIRLQPDYAQAHMNLAILLVRLKREAEAGYHFQYALKVRPDYPLGHLNYGLMLRDTGLKDEAAREFKLAAEGSDANVRAAAAQLLAEIGTPR